MCLKKIVTMVVVFMVAFLFISQPIIVSAAPAGDALTCSDMLDKDLDKMLTTAYTVMQIGAIVLTVIFGSLDFAKAVWSNDQDMLKKASQKFIKRLVAMVVILILPYIIDPVVKAVFGSSYDSCVDSSGQISK